MPTERLDRPKSGDRVGNRIEDYVNPEGFVSFQGGWLVIHVSDLERVSGTSNEWCRTKSRNTMKDVQR